MLRAPLLSLALWLTACSATMPMPVNDAGPEDAGLPGVSPVELCDRLTAARCGLKKRCYTAFARETDATCTQFEQARCLAEYDALKESFDKAWVEVSAANLSACEKRMKTSSCPPAFPPDYPAIAEVPFADCGLQSGLLTGKVKSGQTCERAIDCEPGTLCVKAGGVCRGTCSSYPGEGEPCAFGCAPGLRCDDKGTPSDPADDRCAPPRGLNGLCKRSRECSAELICVAGACRPRGKADEACAFDPDRLSSCDPGLACDVAPFVKGAVGRCVVPQPSGGRCNFHWSCAPGLVCSDLDWTGFPMKAPAPGFCRAPADPDTNCSQTVYQLYVGDQCRAGFECARDSSKCKPVPESGQACLPSVQNCAGVNVYCKPTGSGDVGICTGPSGSGERCAFELDAERKVTIPCTSGYCDTDSTLTCRPSSKPIGAECKQDGECNSGRCAVQQDRTLRCAMGC